MKVVEHQDPADGLVDPQVPTLAHYAVHGPRRCSPESWCLKTPVGHRGTWHFHVATTVVAVVATTVVAVVATTVVAVGVASGKHILLLKYLLVGGPV